MGNSTYATVPPVSQLIVTVVILICGVCQTLSLGFTLPQTSRVCDDLTIDVCKKLNLYNQTVLPNFFEHTNQSEAERAIYTYKEPLNMGCSVELLPFLCALHAPPCQGSINLPCREWCVQIQEQCGKTMEDEGREWPEALQCHLLPPASHHQCLLLTDLQLQNSGNRGLEARHKSQNKPVFMLSPGAITEYDFAKDDVTSPATSFLRRRYDVIDLGDPMYFQGWADVQGQGAANDYCRVIGKKKRRFLSCALAGSSGQGHTFVSQRGVDLGHQSTWFMRDIDGDGRDDYCRCVGEKPQTRISCLKAGQLGFYGSPLQSGDQYTFDIPASGNCHDRPLNPYHGV
ncbi:uncharacterized protein LOC135461529 [Liolophura sinensis]|uniref:uncharacterized protein LOC135461529 n=1 Tax=Liolophura sinensis TaxID=3198878 RepID=UPI003158BC53